MKHNSKSQAGTKDDSSTKDEAATVSQHSSKPHVGGSFLSTDKNRNGITRFRDVAKYYIGCKIKTKEGVGTFSIYWSGGESTKHIGCYDLVGCDWSFDEVKPILRKLSSITKEEAAKVMQMVFHPQVEYPLSDYKLSLNDAGNARIELSNDWYDENLTFGNTTASIWSIDRPSTNVKISAEVHHFLLSKHFDLFNLIGNGEAVLK